VEGQSLSSQIEPGKAIFPDRGKVRVKNGCLRILGKDRIIMCLLLDLGVLLDKEIQRETIVEEEYLIKKEDLRNLAEYLVMMCLGPVKKLPWVKAKEKELEFLVSRDLHRRRTKGRIMW
jgi:hypothetical protein